MAVFDNLSLDRTLPQTGIQSEPAIVSCLENDLWPTWWKPLSRIGRLLGEYSTSSVGTPGGGINRGVPDAIHDKAQSKRGHIRWPHLRGGGGYSLIRRHLGGGTSLKTNHLYGSGYCMYSRKSNWILMIIIDHLTLYSTDPCRQLEFRSALSFQGKRLINHVIKTVESVFKDFCGALCFMEPNCVSYNMELRSPAITNCELNNSTHFEYPSDLKSMQNYIYRGSKVSVWFLIKLGL